jgi:hypothetical protein
MLAKLKKIVISEKDGKVREVEIEYKNATEKKFRSTHRAARSVAVLHSENDLDLLHELAGAARAADRVSHMQEAYTDRQLAVMRDVEKCGGCVVPNLCSHHGAFFASFPFRYPTYEEEVPSQLVYTVHTGSQLPETHEADMAILDSYQAEVAWISSECPSLEKGDRFCNLLHVHTDPWG